MSNFELELIKQVKQYPALYDKSHEFYKHKTKTVEYWETICVNLGHTLENVHFLRTRWRTLRDGFSRSRKKILKGESYMKMSRYKLYTELKFLYPFISSKDEPFDNSNSRRKNRRVNTKNHNEDQGTSTTGIEDTIDVGAEAELSNLCELDIPDVFVKEEDLDEEPPELPPSPLDPFLDTSSTVQPFDDELDKFKDEYDREPEQYPDTDCPFPEVDVKQEEETMDTVDDYTFLDYVTNCLMELSPGLKEEAKKDIRAVLDKYATKAKE